MELANWTKRLLISTLLLFAVLTSVNATNWDDEWNHKRPITISNTAGELKDYQVKVNLNGSNVGPKFNWSNKGDDLRFVDDTNSELNYWIEKWNALEQKAAIWIKVPLLKNNTNTIIYLYHGNPSAISKSNPNKVFPVLNPGFEEIYDDGICNRASYWDFRDSSTGYTSDGWLQIATYPITQGNHSWGIKWTGNSFNNRAYISQNFEMSHSMKISFDILGPSGGNPHRSDHKIYIDDKLIKNCGYVTNGQKKTCNALLLDYVDLHNLKLTWEQRTGDNLGNSKIDNIRVRKYASPEPSVNIGVSNITPELPELTISSSDIGVSNQSVLSKNLTITAEVENRGESSADNITVQVFAGVTGSVSLIGEQIIDFISANDRELVQINWTAEEEGVQQIHVIVDPYNSVIEINESNNEVFKSVEALACPWNSQQKLFQALKSEFAGHGYDFYEKYYSYNDNATNHDLPKKCYTDLDDDDTWINYISSDSRGLYPCSAYLFGPKIGVDTNSWYDGKTPVRGLYYPELELEIIDDWINNKPLVSENKNVKNFLQHLLEVNECGFESDGFYSQGNIIYNEDTNRSEVITKFSGRFTNPGSIVEGGDCQAKFKKYYDADTEQFGDNLKDLSCTVNLDIPVKEAGFGKNVSYSLGLIGFDGKINTGAKLSPSASGGLLLGLNPQCVIPAGNIKANVGLDAEALGELCLASRCYDIESSLPIPEISEVEFTGEAVIPNEDFTSDDNLKSLYPNPNGGYVVYEDLSNLNPVFRVATSEMDINYKMNVNLKEMGIPCGGSLPTSPPCNIDLYDGTLFHIEPWQHYWGFTEVTVHSPVEFHLYDSQGRHVGLNNSGQIELQIPNSTYFEENGTKTIRFPTAVDKFTLYLKGTDDGNYTLDISRPVMIETENGNATIKGVSYRLENISTSRNKSDYYNIDFIEIEREINELVEQGVHTDKALERGSNLIDKVQNATKLPSSLYLRDVAVYNGENVTLYAKMNSLNKSVSNETVIFTLDGTTIGSNVTNNKGEVTLDYSIPQNAEIGINKIKCVFNGSESYYNSTGTAQIHILNNRPRVSLNITDFPSGSVFVNGSVNDSNARDTALKIDGRTVLDSIPYLWDTSEYCNGYHQIKLVANDSFGRNGRAITYVFVHNPIADAGGPYEGLEGQTLLLNGSGSYDPYDEIISWLWDLDEDGVLETNAADGKGEVGYTWGDDYSGNISLQVKDNSGGTDTNSTRITVYNVAPVAEAGPPQEITAGDTAYFNGSFSDPGWLDEHHVSWSFGDGHNSTELETVHTYYQKGSYHVKLAVEDDDGGVGEDTTNVVVNPIPANVTVKPEILNLKSNGKFTAFITLPGKYNITKIDSESVICNNTSAKWVKITDSNLIIAKFEREELNITSGDAANLTIEGEVFHNGDYADFEGSDTVKLKWGKERERNRHQEAMG